MQLRNVMIASAAFSLQTAPATVLREGASPQLAMDTRGTIRVIFGRGDTVFSATSLDNGTRFGPVNVVGVVRGMHLGNTRGPVIASSRTRSLVAAADREGNVHLFQLDHRTNAWKRLAWTLNTVPGSAPEGLGTLAADTADTFHAVWLDYRESRQTHIYFATLESGSAVAPTNRKIYASRDGHVCECCRPSIATSGNTVAVMFRNWLDGNRDMYAITSTDRGKTFGDARKLGSGTWKLDACPMDGGALVLDQSGSISSVWRRELSVYYTSGSQAERVIGRGKNPMLSQRAGAAHIAWQDGTRIRLMALPSGTESIVGEGRLPSLLTTHDGGAFVAWEKDGRVYVRKM
jgi:hypothetical protein